jgi:hypothetical protein
VGKDRRFVNFVLPQGQISGTRKTGLHMLNMPYLARGQIGRRRGATLCNTYQLIHALNVASVIPSFWTLTIYMEKAQM